jgi:WD40 repeat protein
MTFTPDSKYFAFHKIFPQRDDRPDLSIQLVDVTTGKVIRTFKAHPNELSVHDLTFTADGATLISGHAAGFIRAWDVASGKEKRRYGTKGSSISCLALSPDEKTVAYIDGLMVHIQDLATNKDLVPPWNSSPISVNSVAYSPDGKKVAVGGSRIAILDTATGKRLNPELENESQIHQVSYSPDGKVLAVLRDQDHRLIEIWDTARWRKVAILRPKWWKEGMRWDEGGRFRAMTFSPNGKRLTTVEGRAVHGKIQISICHWQPQTGMRQKEFLPEGRRINAFSYSSDGETFLSLDSSPRQSFIFWDAATGQERGRIPCSDLTLENIAGNPQLSPVGSLLACGSGTNTVVLWDTKTGKQIRRFGQRTARYADTLVFSPDGRSIATPAGQGQYGSSTIHPDVVLWETATGKERLRIVRHEGYAHQIAFSPNGRLLAWVDYGGAPHVYDDRIHVWDAWTGKELGQLAGHRGVIRSISFAPDGRTLASGGIDNTILIWDVTGLLPATTLVAEKLSREELARCWDNLVGTDAARAYATIRELAQHPDQAVSLLKAKLTASPKMDAQRLARLIADLDSDDFDTRESASKELAKLGRMAEGALKKTLDENPSAEVKRRIQNLLDKLDPKEDDPEQILLLRVIEVLERLGTPEARRLLQKLAKEASIPDVAREAQASLERLGKAGKGVP